MEKVDDERTVSVDVLWAKIADEAVEPVAEVRRRLLDAVEYCEDS